MESISKYEDLSIHAHKGGVFEVMINRERRLNALSQRVKDELVDFFHRAETSTEVASVVLTGAGARAFAAGQDLQEAKAFTPDQIDSWIDSFHELYSAVIDCRVPTIAAINGYAVGAGFQLAMLCDLRIASDLARFGMPEIDDAIPCITGLWTLYDSIGHSRTSDLILTGRMIDANEAHEWGVVREVVGPGVLRERAVALATEMAKKPAIAVQLNKARLRMLLERERLAAEEFAKTAHRLAYESGLPQKRMAEFLEGGREGRAL